MGLESVEILLAAEETFGIGIPDEAAERMRTPADLVNFILSQVPVAPSPECMSQQMFYRLRRGFRVQVPALVKKFQPDTKLSEILHKDQWPKVWSAVRDSVGDAVWPAEIPCRHCFGMAQRRLGS